MGVIRIAGLILLGVYLSACGIPIVQGSGNILREQIAVEGFERVMFSGSGELVITEGNEENLTVSGDEEVLPLITTEVRNGTLVISEEALDERLVLINEPIRYFLTVDDLTALAMNTPGTVTLEGLSGEKILLEAGGGGTITVVDLTARELVVRVGGTSTIVVSGEVELQKILIKEAGTYQGANLRSITADVTMTDAGTGTVWVVDFLDAKISGRGGLDLYGSPEVVRTGPGPGEVTNLGER